MTSCAPEFPYQRDPWGPDHKDKATRFYSEHDEFLPGFEDTSQLTCERKKDRPQEGTQRAQFDYGEAKPTCSPRPELRLFHQYSHKVTQCTRGPGRKSVCGILLKNFSFILLLRKALTRALIVLLCLLGLLCLLC